MYKKIFILIAACLLPLSLTNVYAEDAFQVQARVPSPVSADVSTVKTNTNTALADPASHSILITIVLKDGQNNILPHKEVKVTSSRGDIDIIESTSKLLKSRVQAADISDVPEMQRDETDDNGSVSFRVTSFISGSSKINIIADSVVSLSPVDLTFRPLPFPLSITIVTKCPILNSDLVLLSGEYHQEGLSQLQKSYADKINPGTRIYIPWWVLLLIVIILITLLAAIINSIIARCKLGKVKEEEREILKKIASSNNIQNLKKEVCETIKQ